MTDPDTLVAMQSVAALTPYLVEVGKGMASKAGEAAFVRVAALWDKVSTRLRARGAAQALERYASAPLDPRRQGAVEADIEDALRSDAEWREEIASLVRELVPSATTQSASVTGDDNVVAQNAGHNNAISIAHQATRT